MEIQKKKSYQFSAMTTVANCYRETLHYCSCKISNDFTVFSSFIATGVSNGYNPLITTFQIKHNGKLRPSLFSSLHTIFDSIKQRALLKSNSYWKPFTVYLFEWRISLASCTVGRISLSISASFSFHCL